jgi:hypothetical protein
MSAIARKFGSWQLACAVNRFNFEDLQTLETTFLPNIHESFFRTPVYYIPSEEYVFLYAPDEVLQQFEKLGLNILRANIHWPPKHTRPHTLFLPLNDLRRNGNVHSEVIYSRLHNLLFVLVNWGVLKKRDFDIYIHLKRDAWFGFVNLNRDLTTLDCTLVYSWLRFNFWGIPGVKRRIYVRYSKKK